MGEASEDQDAIWAARVLAAAMEPTGAVLDLRGRTWPSAQRALQALLSTPRPGARVAIQIDPPKGDGVQSLFQPVGKRLRDAVRAGKLESCRPLAPEQGLGFQLVFRE